MTTQSAARILQKKSWQVLEQLRHCQLFQKCWRNNNHNSGDLLKSSWWNWVIMRRIADTKLAASPFIVKFRLIAGVGQQKKAAKPKKRWNLEANLGRNSSLDKFWRLPLKILLLIWFNELFLETVGNIYAKFDKNTQWELKNRVIFGNFIRKTVRK